jgi:HSP20 family protein
MFDLVPFRFNDWERKFFPEFFGEEVFRSGLASFKTDISDTGSAYLLEAELPGFSKEDIAVEVNDDRLTISAKRDEGREETQTNYLRKERRIAQVSRSFILNGVNREAIDAEFKDGILKLTLPKAAEEKIPVRKIDIH